MLSEFYIYLRTWIFQSYVHWKQHTYPFHSIFILHCVQNNKNNFQFISQNVAAIACNVWLDIKATNTGYLCPWIDLLLVEVIHFFHNNFSFHYKYMFEYMLNCSRGRLFGLKDCSLLHSCLFICFHLIYLFSHIFCCYNQSLFIFCWLSTWQSAKRIKLIALYYENRLLKRIWILLTKFFFSYRFYNKYIIKYWILSTKNSLTKKNNFLEICYP